MRKKGPRSIPDFSRKKNAPPVTGLPPLQAPAPPVPLDRVVRAPQAKPPKTGRRGS
jgi:hypothetical protein